MAAAGRPPEYLRQDEEGAAMDAVTGGILLPALVLAALGWVVPRALARVFPEGVRPLLWLALTATGVVMALGVGFFVLLYAWNGIPLRVVLEDGFGPALAHFGRLAAISALLWGPIMVLSIAGLPKNWVEETW